MPTVCHGLQARNRLLQSIQDEARQQVRGVRSLNSVVEGVTDVRYYNSGTGNVTEAGELNQEGAWQE